MTRYVKFMRGTTAAYKNLTSKDDDTLYFLSDSVNEEGSLYLGERLISGPGATLRPETLKLTDLLDVIVANDLNYDALLMFNPTTKQWESYSFDDLKFQGASATVDGLAGLVPAPKAGQENLFLRGDGTWAPAGASHQTFEGVANANETHPVAITRIIADSIVNHGDLVIVKDLLTEDKYQYTTYVYDDGTWKAMDGAYDAENVYFKSDLVFTEAIGTVTIPSTGSATIATTGKNVKQLMEMLFAEERNPNVYAPSITLTTNHGSYEVGTKITPSYSFTCSPGVYEFGPNTGIVHTSYNIAATNNLIEVENVHSDSYPTDGIVEGTMPTEVQIKDNTNYYLTATVAYNASTTIPVTNLNNYYDDGKLPKGTATCSSGAFNGYRAFFYGMDATGATLDSAFVRDNLINGGAYDRSKTLSFTAAELEGVKRFLILVPSSSTRGGVSKATITSSMNADATNDYVLLESTVDVEGVDGYDAIPYKVWVYEPASIASTEVHSVILN